ncbi:hypothetical protein [Pseudomonas sp. UBA1879]|uniref:hypothetical protein n=1 Tax=Pseudomonas sp. UBA1879 TaxID=1947305 RepID=UPI0025E6A99D|nr:hypothetical protein [Pseudomonas sp. UBA1879]
MTWFPVSMQWPEEATRWMGDLDAAKDMAASDLQGAGQRLDSLKDLATTDLSQIGDLAKNAAAIGRDALNGQFGEAPRCITVTPFQPGVGEGTGYQRALSAPSVVQRLADKLQDVTDPNRPEGEQHAVVILFLGTRYDGMSSLLGKFNALMPIGDLQRAERRAKNLVQLDLDKWNIPVAGEQPQWISAPMERCTVLREASQAFNGQLASLESYAANSSPLSDLADLAQRKAEQAVEQGDRLAALRDLLNSGTDDAGMQARMIGPGDTAELRKQLLESDNAPGHEWVMSSGVMFVGSLKGLSFVREMLGL